MRGLPKSAAGEFERAFLTLSLERARGNVTRAAERAGLQRQSLQQKLKELGLSRRYVRADEAPDPPDDV